MALEGALPKPIFTSLPFEGEDTGDGKWQSGIFLMNKGTFVNAYAPVLPRNLSVLLAFHAFLFDKILLFPSYIF